MKIITLNLNGIRSAAKYGFFEWLRDENADVICVQEVKAHNVDELGPSLQLEGYYSYFHLAEKKGYSGVGIYSKEKPLKLEKGLGWPHADQEGRYIEADFGKVIIASIYLPSGSSGEHRQVIKFDFLERFKKILQKIREAKREFILCGDWNIAHKNIDLKNWRGNQKNSGFLPEERAWLDEIFDSLGFIDVFREVNQNAEEYTWWSNRGQARAKNVGWRIDYQIATPGLKNLIKSAKIYREKRFSDHAPLIIEYKL